MTLAIPSAYRKALPGEPVSIGQAREWVLAQLPLREDHPRAGDIALVASELATNAVRHSASGAPGGRFSLLVEVEDGSTAEQGSMGLTVIDLGPALVSAPRPEGEGGRGLEIVRTLADAYEVIPTPTSRTVWCRMDWMADHTADQRVSRGEST